MNNTDKHFLEKQTLQQGNSVFKYKQFSSSTCIASACPC